MSIKVQWPITDNCHVTVNVIWVDVQLSKNVSTELTNDKRSFLANLRKRAAGYVVCVWKHKAKQIAIQEFNLRTSHWKVQFSSKHNLGPTLLKKYLSWVDILNWNPPAQFACQRFTFDRFGARYTRHKTSYSRTPELGILRLWPLRVVK